MWGVSTHLSNTLGMLANHYVVVIVIVIGSGSLGLFGLSKS